MSLLLVGLLGCGWWESYQACSAAEEADIASWEAFEAAIETAAVAASAQAAASYAAAGLVDSRLTEARSVPSAAPTLGRAEAAQDAFTRASKVAGAEKAASDARWMDWSMKTQEQARTADQLRAQSEGELERVAGWGSAHRDATVAAVLATASYEARVRTGAARLALRLEALAAPTAPPEEEEAAALVAPFRSRMEAAGQHKAVLDSDLLRVLGEVDRHAYALDAAAQTAESAAGNYEFMGFPPEVLIAKAAALAASAASGHASASASVVRKGVVSGREASAIVSPPEAVVVGLARALELAAVAEQACP